jgi:hypothetical protein
MHEIMDYLSFKLPKAVNQDNHIQSNPTVALKFRVGIYWIGFSEMVKWSQEKVWLARNELVQNL